MKEVKKSNVAAKELEDLQSEIKSKHADCDFIPCLYLEKLGSDKIFIHFHANGEDIGQVFTLLEILHQNFNMGVLAVEYPGYGLYKENKLNKQYAKKSDQILKDAETVIEFV